MTTSDERAEQEATADGGRQSAGARDEIGNTDGEQEWEWEGVEDEDVQGHEHKAEQGVSDGEGGVQGSTVPCDFITEFIAPGGGHGRCGAGKRLLHELWRRGGARADGDIHGYVWRGNANRKHKGGGGGGGSTRYGKVVRATGGGTGRG